MKFYTYLSLAVALSASLMMASCGKGKKALGDLMTYVPQNASVVFFVNSKQIFDKLDKNKVLNAKELDPAFEEFPGMKALLANPEESGLDVSKNMIAYFEIKGEKEGKGGFFMHVKDAEKLKAQIEKQAKDEKITTQGEFSYLFKNSEFGEKRLIVWNKEMFAILIGQELTEEAYKTAFEHKKEHIGKIAHAQKTLSGGNDIVAWANVGQILSESETLASSLAITGVTSEVLLEGNYMGGHMDFKNGKIESEANYTFNEALVKEFGRIFNAKMNFNPDAFFPETPAISASLALNMKGIYELTESRGVNGLLEGQSRSLGISYQEFSQALTGDIAFAIYPSETVDVSAILGTSSKEAGVKLLGFIEKMVKAQSRGQANTSLNGEKLSIEIKGAPVKVYVVAIDTALFITTNAALADKPGKANGAKDPAISAMSKNTITTFIDYQQIPAMLKGMKIPGDEFEKNPTFSFMKLQTYTANDKGATAVQYFKDEKTNAINILVDMSIASAKYQAERYKKVEDPFGDENEAQEGEEVGGGSQN